MLRPGGAVLWYDFFIKNPRNPHTRPIRKATLQSYFPEFDIELKTLTLFPPLARRLGPLTPMLYPALASLPFLRGHYLGLLSAPGEPASRTGSQQRANLEETEFVQADQQRGT